MCFRFVNNHQFSFKWTSTMLYKPICTLIVILFCKSMIVDSRIEFEKLERQVDPEYAQIKSTIKEVNGESMIDIEADSFFDGDDIMVHYYQNLLHHL